MRPRTAQCAQTRAARASRLARVSLPPVLADPPSHAFVTRSRSLFIGSCALWLAASLAGCNLVGYDELTSPVSADNGARAADGGGAASESDGALSDTGKLDGSSDARALDGALQAQLDAAQQGALSEAGWWSGRAPDVTCSAGQRCYPSCQPAAGSCVFDCADASECQGTCLPGTACEVACAEAGRCFMACKKDSYCWLDCRNAPDCEGWCTKGAHCQIDCANAQSCRAMCLPGASCDIDCSGKSDCSAFTCSLGAACLMHCPSTGCQLGCEGVASSCPDNIRVCNRDCP
ncbi:MAG: hypothetical protein JWN04_3780 [Myxococcaceae bacterium]|nr:hypothetical protein [Myxococcaceae bacterium]